MKTREAILFILGLTLIALGPFALAFFTYHERDAGTGWAVCGGIMLAGWIMLGQILNKPKKGNHESSSKK